MLPNAGCVLVSVTTVFRYLKISEVETRENGYHTPEGAALAVHTRFGEYINRARAPNERTDALKYRPRFLKSMEQRVHASGHEHVSAEHTSTFELTSDDWLTPAGDCILGIEADTVPADFDDAFVEACRSHDATITVTLRAEDHEQVIEGRGHPDLTFENDRSMVGRTSDYVDDRTIVVGCDAAAADLDRDFVEALASGANLECVLTVDA
jgi:hypothetical protein